MDSLRELRARLRDVDSAVLGFSGGLGSVFLAHMLKEAGRRFVAVTVDHGMLPDRDAISETARRLGVEHRFVEVDLLGEKYFIENTPERCYLCKKAMISALRRFAAEEGYATVLDASDQDDLQDYRAAMVAVYEEGVETPLIDAGLSREEIGRYAREMGLPVPRRESCMATRIPAETWIRREVIERVRGFERDVRRLGFSAVKARVHDSLLRVQLPEEELEMGVRHREEILEAARRHGFAFAAIDTLPLP
ncbi:MAG: hypothetical protein GXO66_03655 [Euryarchaeota archaeon]|nr:hypothetical protein [Euryarchaeota archaeon]